MSQDYTKNEPIAQGLRVKSDPDKRTGSGKHQVDEVGLESSGTVGLPPITGDLNINLGGVVKPHLGDDLKAWFMGKLERGEFQIQVTSQPELGTSYCLVTMRADRVGLVMASDDHYYDFLDRIQQLQQEAATRKAEPNGQRD